MLYSSRGFTLLELLIVVAVVGILASIIMVAIGYSPVARSRDARRVTQATQLQKAVETHFLERGRYPGEENVWYTNTGGDNWWIRHPDWTHNQGDPRLVGFYDDLGPYLPSMPKTINHSRSVYGDSAGDCHQAGGGQLMQYRHTGNNYKVSIRLEADCDKVINDGGTSTCCPVMPGSAGRSYEVYELFSPGAAAALPIW